MKKTTRKPLIFAIILLAAAHLGAASGTPMLKLELSDNGSADAVHQIDRLTSALLRSAATPPSWELKIKSSPQLPAGKWNLRFERKTLLLQLPADPRWRENRETLTLLCRIMLLHRSGAPLRLAGKYEIVPLWIPAGMIQQLQSHNGSERYLRSNRVLPATCAMLEAQRTPDLAALGEVSLDDETPGARQFFEETARVRLECAHAKQLFVPYFKTLVRDGNPDKAEEMLNRAITTPVWLEQAMRMAWNEWNPRPARLAQILRKTLDTVNIDELNAQGKPTGREKNVPLKALPVLLEKRPDAAEIRSKLVSSWHAFGSGEPRNIQMQLRSIMMEAQTLSSANAPRFFALIAELDAELARRAAVEQYLAEAEARSCGIRAGAARMLGVIAAECDGGRPALSPAAMRYLESVERDYLE